MNQCCDNNKIEQLWLVVKALQLTLTVYNTTLFGYSLFIPKNTHKLNFVRGYLCLDPTGNSVKIEFDVLSDQSIQINSNILLDNHKLIIF